MNINSLCWPAAKIAIIYAVVSSIWVLASDPLLAYFLDDAETLSKLQTIADGFYILATAALLFWLIRRQIISANEKENYDRTLFQMSPVGLALCQMNGELVDVNKAFAQILGRSVEETLQLSYWDITPKEYAENEQHQLHELKKTGRYGPYEKEYIHKSGRRIPVQLSGTLLERGGERFIWSSVEDITERKEAENNLQVTKGMLRSVLDTIPVAVFWKDFNLNYLGCNLRAAKDAGLNSPDEIIGKNDFDLAWKEQAEIYRSDDRKVMQTEIPLLDYEEAMIRPDSTKRWLATSKIPLRDSKGNIFGVLGTYEDITERKEEEKTLKGIVEGISSTIGDKFLQSTVQHLASALNVRYAWRSQPVNATHALNR